MFLTMNKYPCYPTMVIKLTVQDYLAGNQSFTKNPELSVSPKMTPCK